MLNFISNEQIRELLNKSRIAVENYELGYRFQWHKEWEAEIRRALENIHDKDKKQFVLNKIIPLDENGMAKLLAEPTKFEGSIPYYALENKIISSDIMNKRSENNAIRSRNKTIVMEIKEIVLAGLTISDGKMLKLALENMFIHSTGSWEKLRAIRMAAETIPNYSRAKLVIEGIAKCSSYTQWDQVKKAEEKIKSYKKLALAFEMMKNYYSEEEIETIVEIVKKIKQPEMLEFIATTLKESNKKPLDTIFEAAKTLKLPTLKKAVAKMEEYDFNSFVSEVIKEVFENITDSKKRKLVLQKESTISKYTRNDWYENVLRMKQNRLAAENIEDIEILKLIIQANLLTDGKEAMEQVRLIGETSVDFEIAKKAIEKVSPGINENLDFYKSDVETMKVIHLIVAKIKDSERCSLVLDKVNINNNRRFEEPHTVAQVEQIRLAGENIEDLKQLELTLNNMSDDYCKDKLQQIRLAGEIDTGEISTLFIKKMTDESFMEKAIAKMDADPVLQKFSQLLPKEALIFSDKQMEAMVDSYRYWREICKKGELPVTKYFEQALERINPTQKYYNISNIGHNVIADMLVLERIPRNEPEEKVKGQFKKTI